MSDLRLLSFLDLVDRSLTDPRAREELESRYLAEAAILVVDFTGMVRRSDRDGIIAALATARAAAAAMTPAITAHRGQLIKLVADTLFAVFPDSRRALLAAFDAQSALALFNRDRPDDPIHPCAGLGFGPCYLLPGEDIYGAEVNRAFVLGEDVAEGGQILVTPAFRAALGDIPQGVGLHAANADLAHRVGFHFFEIRDYRD
jgi:adenylate cyclase